MNDWFPMDEEQSTLQIDSIIDMLGSTSLDIVDVGCGDGRVLIPLVKAGHRLIGVDSDSVAIDACRTRCKEEEVEAELICGDLFDILPRLDPVDAIICCGQTFMLFADVDQAVKALRLFRALLHNGGVVILDDIPGDLWPEVSQGMWATGINDEETMQLVWADNDAVFSIREGDKIDPTSWQLREDDQPLRLWTMGALRLAAQLADLSAPEVPVAGAVLIMWAKSGV